MSADSFDEVRLRADIVRVWGEHGAHVDVFDHMARLAGRARDQARIAGPWSFLDVERLDHVPDCECVAADAFMVEEADPRCLTGAWDAYVVCDDGSYTVTAHRLADLLPDEDTDP